MRWFLIILVYLLLDFYAFQAVRTLIRNPWVNFVYIAVTVIALAGLFYEFALAGTPKSMSPPRNYIFGFFLVVSVPKIILVLSMFGEDIVRVGMGVVSKINGNSNGEFMASRRKFISTMAIGVASIPFLSLIHGIIQGKYNYRVLKYVLEFDDLPESFDGYTITQLSDIHSGSFDSREKVGYGIRLANKQNSDIIVFTGDLVNNVSEEMTQWKDLFSKLEARDGVYSVLGNHDYGDYAEWDRPEQKEANLQRLKDIQKGMGWDLLLNENRFLERNGERIALIGVENWGKGFIKAGDLERASVGVKNSDFKVLLSHDPSHWELKVKSNPKNYHLTLSGHTHGMQFGIEIPGIVHWSPIQYKYKQWAGVYEKSGRFINVNRGFGYLAYPGRVGIWPEITVIELKKKRPIV